jgi:hypothetical protein
VWQLNWWHEAKLSNWNRSQPTALSLSRNTSRASLWFCSAIITCRLILFATFYKIRFIQYHPHTAFAIITQMCQEPQDITVQRSMETLPTRMAVLQHPNSLLSRFSIRDSGLNLAKLSFPTPWCWPLGSGCRDLAQSSDHVNGLTLFQYASTQPLLTSLLVNKESRAIGLK